MPADFKSLLVVIPTRNRADLAINAIRSVLDDAPDNVSVLVSDNSTLPEQRVRLAEFCRQVSQTPHASGRLCYVAPPAPLPMPHHWHWAMEQALERHNVSHVTYLSDRMVFRRGEVNTLARLAVLHPASVISYEHDKVADDAAPIRLEQLDWSGNLLEISAAHLLRLTSQLTLPTALPRMMNCVVPRVVLEAVSDRFGNYFDSISPDFNFCYRCLSIVDNILFYDKSALIQYALSRSNGTSYQKGISTADHQDFMRNLDNKINYASPVPEFQVVGNAIVHEYCLVQQESMSTDLPKVDWKRYLEFMAAEVSRLENADLKRDMEALLERHGRPVSRISSAETKKRAFANSYLAFTAHEAEHLRDPALKLEAHAWLSDRGWSDNQAQLPPVVIAVSEKALAASPASNGNDAAFVGQSAPTTMKAGESYPMSVIVRNAGTQTWTYEDLYRLGAMPGRKGKRVQGLERVEFPVGTCVPPGAEVTIRFWVTAPFRPGKYTFQWQMVQENVQWFGAPTPPLRVLVTAPQASAARRVVGGFVWRSGVRLGWWARGAFTKPIWLLLNRRLGVPPPEENRFVFRTSEEAITYANRFPRQSGSEALTRLRFLIEPNGRVLEDGHGSVSAERFSGSPHGAWAAPGKS